ncbi:MAG: F0F1 ATP synthase subunit B [Gammaproteobacteria bacterium]|nr:F0F1 ATP synthase subunit B [Gammaproteobacteria bacterium]
MDFNATLIGQTIAMIFFVWFTMKFIWPPIMNAIEARQVAIADGIAAAQRGQTDLENAKAEAAKIIAEARDQARSIIDQANSRASAILEAAKAEAEAEKQRRLEAARAQIDVEINRAREELRGQVAAIAVAGAERILKREIDAAAHRDLLERLAAEL